MATVVGTNSRGGVAKVGKNSSASKKAQYAGSANNASTLGQLESVAAQAKSLGIDTSKAESMISQTKSQGSTPYKGSSFETNYLNSQNLAPTPQIQLPPQPTIKDTGDVAGANNVGLATGLSQYGYSIDENNRFVYTPPKDNAPQNTNVAPDLLSFFNSSLETPSGADIYAREYKKSGVKEAQNEVNNYTAQLNAITAKQNADLLRLRGAGAENGVTEAVYGGQQATINREAAIAALPVQAQLAAAQGNLQMAQEHLDTMFKIKYQDALTEYQYQKEKLNSIKDYLTKVEERQYNARLAEEDKKYKEQQDFLTAQRNALSNALAQGAPSSVYNAIKTATDINGVISAAGKYNGDVLGTAIKQEQLNQLRTKPTSSGEAPTIKTINGVDMQWDPATGSWVTPQGSSGPGTTPMTTQLSGTLNDIDTLLQTSETNLGEFLGKRNIIQRNIPGTVENQFSIQHDNLINQLALAARGQLKGQGQVSDFEGKLLKSAQTTLNLYMEPKAYLKELKQIRGAIKTSSGVPAYVSVKTSDGKETRYAVLGSQDIQDAVNQGYVIEYQ